MATGSCQRLLALSNTKGLAKSSLGVTRYELLDVLLCGDTAQSIGSSLGFTAICLSSYVVIPYLGPSHVLLVYLQDRLLYSCFDLLPVSKTTRASLASLGPLLPFSITPPPSAMRVLVIGAAGKSPTLPFC